MKQIKNISSFVRVGNEEPIKTEHLSYDTNGNLILSKKYDLNGELIEKAEFAYNGKNQKTEEKQYLSETELAQEHKYQYDEDGRLKEIHKVFAEGYESCRKIDIDPETKSRVELELDENGEIEEKHTWLYMDNKLTEQAEYDENNRLVRKIQYDFDDKGRVTEEREYEKKDKKPVQVKQYQYRDGSDKVLFMKILNRKGKIIDQYRLEYDEKDRISRQVSPVSGTIEIEYPTERKRIERNMDVNGNIRAETTYQYDEQENLIKEETPLQITEYKIEYF